MNKRVKCVSTAWTGKLVEGQIYEATLWNTATQECELVDYPGVIWNINRFEEVETATLIRVKCLDPSGYEDYLTKGKIYQVKEHFSDSSGEKYRLEGVEGFSFRARRFTIVDQPDPPTKTFSAPTTPAEVAEERCWQAMRPHLEPGHCPCGCLKELCFIHQP